MQNNNHSGIYTQSAEARNTITRTISHARKELNEINHIRSLPNVDQELIDGVMAVKACNALNELKTIEWLMADRDKPAKEDFYRLKSVFEKLND